MSQKFYKQQLGQRGEIIARNYYQSLGFNIICQNFYTRYGELDLVLQKDKQILVVEVKTRSNTKFGWAEESINDQKLQRIDQSYQILQADKGLPEFYQLEICIIKFVF